MSFYIDGAEFLSHKEQEVIARGSWLGVKQALTKLFLRLTEDCEIMQVGERSFHCFRKDKFGMNLMAECDHLCCFCWADLKHPGKTSDYLAVSTSPLGLKLEHDNNGIIQKGYTMAGDNAWAPREWVVSVLQPKEHLEYLFTDLGFCGGPLSVSMLKVLPLVMALMKLHSFCIDSNRGTTPSTFHLDEHSICRMASSRGSTETTRNATDVHLDSRGIPDELIGSGHHFRDLPCQRRPYIPVTDDEILTEVMQRQEAMQGLQRPLVDKYAGKKRKRG
ncbi:hypothetical protein ACHAW6_003114 [Cyclotella cf. meneghiniana]